MPCTLVWGIIMLQGKQRVKEMKEYASVFYKSKAWQRCRDGYAKSVGYLCERCMRQGIYKHGDIVHHKMHITPDNICDPDITLNWDNLELLCRECHAEEHGKKRKRYKVDEYGRVST